MITYSEALAIVKKMVGPLDVWRDGVKVDVIEVVVLEEYTIERPYGWFFFYQSKRYMDNPSDHCSMLAGNGAILIDKDGNSHNTGTAYPTEHYVAKYDKQFGVE